MRRRIALGFLCLLGLDVTAQLGFKAAAMGALPAAADVAWLLRVLAQPTFWLALLGYLGAFATWMGLLRHAPLGPAFAASHLEVVLVIPFAMALFGEAVGWTQLAGALAILAGIVCLAREEHS